MVHFSALYSSSDPKYTRSIVHAGLDSNFIEADEKTPIDFGSGHNEWGGSSFLKSYSRLSACTVQHTLWNNHWPCINATKLSLKSNRFFPASSISLLFIPHTQNKIPYSSINSQDRF